MTWIVVGLAVVVIASVLLVVAARRRRPDGVTTFQRQIDALSPDARRSVVRSVQDLDRRKSRPRLEGEGDVPAEPPARRAAEPRRGMLGDPLGGGEGGGAGGTGGAGVNDGA